MHAYVLHLLLCCPATQSLRGAAILNGGVLSGSLGWCKRIWQSNTRDSELGLFRVYSSFSLTRQTRGCGQFPEMCFMRYYVCGRVHHDLGIITCAQVCVQWQCVSVGFFGWLRMSPEPILLQFSLVFFTYWCVQVLKSLKVGGCVIAHWLLFKLVSHSSRKWPQITFWKCLL
jgi:hypothetical protein